mgnify:FL=1
MELLEQHLNQLKGAWELKEIINIGRQIVSGVNWYVVRIILIILQLSSLIIRTIDGKFEEKNEGKLYRLTVKIYDIPWLNVTEGTFLIT